MTHRPWPTDMHGNEESTVRALERRNEEIRLLLEAGRQLGRTLNLEEIYDVLYDIVVQIMPCTTLAVISYDGDEQLLHCQYARHRGKRLETCHLPAIALGLPESSVQARAINTGEARLIDDWGSEAADNPCAMLEIGRREAMSPQTALIVPMKVEGAVTGVVHVLSEENGAYGESELQFLEALAAQIAAAGANALLYRQAQQEIAERQLAEASEREQRVLAEALADTSAFLNRTLDLDEVLDRILEQVGRVAPHQGANIMLIKDGVALVRRHYGYRSDYGMSPYLLNFGFDVQKAATLRTMVQTRQAMIVPDTAAFDEWLNTPDGNWMRSYAAAPIVLRDEVIGFLNLDADTPNFFSAAHAERLQAFANQVAVALRNAQLYEAELQRRQIAEMLIEAAAALNATLDVDQVLLRVLEQLGKVIPYDSAAVQQLEDDALVIRAATGFENVPKLLNRRTAVELQRPSRNVVKYKKPLAIRDVRESVPTFPISGDLTEFGKIRSWLGLPLLVNEQVVGIITVDRHAVQPFTSEEVSLAQSFASHAALALQNAQLYKALARHSDFLESAVDARTSELQRTVEQMNAIVNYSPQAIILTGVDGDVEKGNPAVEKLFGYAAKELETVRLQSLFADSDRETFDRALQGALAARDSQRLQLSAQRRDGTIFDADVALTPIVERGQVSNLMCSIHDISGLKEVERMKDAFVSNVSHELRTPISSLKLYHGLLAREPSKWDTYMQRMEREIDRLNVIIEDLLRLSRLEQGRVELQMEPADLRVLVEQHVMDRRPLAEQRNLSLVIDEVGQPAPVIMDRGLMGQVFSILLTNALNYTPAGGHIEIGIGQKAGGGEQYRGFSVRDDGPGIRPDEQPQLFKRFFRGEVGRKSGASGTGLGLSIAEEIVRQHRGTIEVESEGIAGQGATFRVWLPEATPNCCALSAKLTSNNHGDG